MSAQHDSQTARTPVLELKGLSKSFGGLHAVRDVTFRVMPGDRKAIIGPNGAGKTTLFNLITGIFPSTSGQVLLFGQDVTEWQSHRRTALGMARTFQITHLFPQADRARQRAAGDQGPAPVEIRDVALPVVVPRRLRQGAPAARTSRLHGSQGHRSSLPFARRAAPARDRSRARQRSENTAARRAGRRTVVGRVGRDDEVPDEARSEARDPPDRARHGRRVRRCSRRFPFCISAKFWKPARPSRSRTARRSRKSTWGRAEPWHILEVQDIHTYYGDAYVLQGLSLKLEQGQILGLLGRNGVGKTTLVNSIVGFTPPRRGKIVFKGDDITHNSSFETVRTGMGLVPQGRRVFPTLSVEENLLVAERHTERHGWNLERVYDAVSAAAGAPRPARQDAVRRRAADARHRPRPDDQSGLPDHGRAVRGAGADHHPGRVGGDRQAQAGGPVDPAGRAERHRSRSSSSTTSTS